MDREILRNAVTAKGIFDSVPYPQEALWRMRVECEDWTIEYINRRVQEAGFALRVLEALWQDWARFLGDLYPDVLDSVAQWVSSDIANRYHIYDDETRARLIRELREAREIHVPSAEDAQAILDAMPADLGDYPTCAAARHFIDTYKETHWSLLYDVVGAAVDGYLTWVAGADEDEIKETESGFGTGTSRVVRLVISAHDLLTRIFDDPATIFPGYEPAYGMEIPDIDESVREVREAHRFLFPGGGGGGGGGGGQSMSRGAGASLTALARILME